MRTLIALGIIGILAACGPGKYHETYQMGASPTPTSGASSGAVAANSPVPTSSVTPTASINQNSAMAGTGLTVTSPQNNQVVTLASDCIVQVIGTCADVTNPIILTGNAITIQTTSTNCDASGTFDVSVPIGQCNLLGVSMPVFFLLTQKQADGSEAMTQVMFQVLHDR